ncbi:MAG: hydrogenase-4 component E [Azospirillum sp.]|nr:hydrogenase-4 component E [Azospirillum sp.]
MTSGISYDVAHLLGAVVLLISFALLVEQRVIALISTFAAQGVVLSLAALWEGWSHNIHHLYLSAAIIFTVKAMIIPMTLNFLVGAMKVHHHETDPGLGVGGALAIGISLVVLSIVSIFPIAPAVTVLTKESLALAFSVLLHGMLMMVTRRNAISQLIGFMSIENGLLMAAIGVQGMPLAVEVSIAFTVLVAAFIFGIFIFGIRDRVETLDIHQLDLYRGERH